MANELLVQAIAKAIRAHGAWKLKLRTAISCGTSQVEPSTIRQDNLCDFGKWLYGAEIDAALKAGQSYKDIKQLHAAFHQCAAEVMELALRNEKDKAAALLEGDFSNRSQKLVSALTRWKSELSASSAAA